MDLRAIETGENIDVTFTLPQLTTDGLPLTNVRSVELRVSVAGESPATFEVPATGPGPLSRSVPAQAWIDKDVVLAARATGSTGKMASWSNEWTLHVQKP